MGTAERRERARQEIRILILDAAREMFAADGYEAVTLRKIAERVEYSPAAIYLHFADKEALFAELVAHDMAAFGERLLKLRRIAGPMERLRKAGQAYLDFALELPNHYRLLFMNVRPRDSEAPAEGEAAARGVYAFIKETVAEAIAADLLRPELDDADTVAQTMWAGVHGMAALHIALCIHKRTIAWRPVKERMAMMVDVLLAGLARPATKTKSK